MNMTIKEFSDLGAREMREVLANLKPSIQEVLGSEGVVKTRDTRAVLTAKYTSYVVMNVDKIHGLKADRIVEDEARGIDQIEDERFLRDTQAAAGLDHPWAKGAEEQSKRMRETDIHTKNAVEGFSGMLINTGLDHTSLVIPNPKAPPPLNRGDVVKKMVSQIVPTLLKIKQLPKPNNRRQSRQYDHVVRPVRKALQKHGITLAEALAAV